MSFIFFLNESATSDISTFTLHDALPISSRRSRRGWTSRTRGRRSGSERHGARLANRAVTRTRSWLAEPADRHGRRRRSRSEEHTSELQSRLHLVCRLLLEKKKQL